jgi:hypothetical protein
MGVKRAAVKELWLKLAGKSILTSETLQRSSQK